MPPAPRQNLATIVKERRGEWLAIAAVCLSLASAYTLGGQLRRAMRGEEVAWTLLSDANLVHFSLWVLLYPGVVAMAVWFPIGERRRRRLAVHLAAAFVFSPLLMSLTYLVRTLTTRSARLSARSWLQDAVVPELAWGLTAYLVMLSVAHALEYRRRHRAAAEATRRLEVALAGARLQCLQMQLQPHFLFNALNVVSSLIHRDPDAAERMVTRLGDLLRLTLDESAPHTVPLRRELDLLEGYLAIERARFRDRLTVDVDVAPRALEANVPYLILQPLAENAVRHGVARRAGPGCITVRARVRRGFLALELRDDGEGLGGRTGPEGNGVGLSNTRARLEQLYGTAARLRLVERRHGGATARLVLPFHSEGVASQPAERP